MKLYSILCGDCGAWWNTLSFEATPNEIAANHTKSTGGHTVKITKLF